MVENIRFTWFLVPQVINPPEENIFTEPFGTNLLKWKWKTGLRQG